MTLIKSISGIRGTIGGEAGTALTPIDIVKFTSGFGKLIINKNNGNRCKIVVGRDARISGAMVEQLVTATLAGLGIDVVNLGLSTTPSTELAVVYHRAQGGIIITASHNPRQWNALKLLNDHGEFISEADGKQMLEFAENQNFGYADVMSLGKITSDTESIERHIQQIINLPLVNKKAIADAKFKVVVDAVNSVGGLAVPYLLEALQVEEITKLYCEPDGMFPHNPEPLPENLNEISKLVVKQKAHLGIVVDPDVDRLALVCEDGEMFGEEYTLVAIADYVLTQKKGNTVSNLSSTRALRDITEKAGLTYFSSAVGEVNVVQVMKEKNAVIGGEGNGGIILPELHYGRDALVGIALFLSHLATWGKTTSLLRKKYPEYHISKNKIELTPDIDVDDILLKMQEKYKRQPMHTIDGVKIEFDKEWVHLRKSNTEPIIRIYSESQSMTTAQYLAQKIMSDIGDIVKDKRNNSKS